MSPRRFAAAPVTSQAEAVARLAAHGEDALLLSAADPEGRHRVVAATGAVVPLLGVPAERSTGAEPWALLDPAGREPARWAAIGDVVGTDGTATATVAAPRDRDGVLDVVVTRVGGEWVWRIRDATARHALDAELEQLARLDAVGSLSGELAHDLGNLLMIVQSAVGAARARVRGDEVLGACLAEAELAAGRGHDLVARVVAAHRQGTGDAPELLDLAALVGDLVPLLRRLAGPGVEVVVDLVAPGPRVFADPGDLELVLLNLIANARDALAGTGGRVRIAVERDDDEVRLLVDDDGPGMDEATLQRATDRFYTTKSRGQGTGLGLWSVRTSLERQAGRLVLRSAPGAGTTAIAVLPHPPAHVLRPRGSMRPFSVAGPVLVVEDDAALRWLVVSGLRLAGFEVLEDDGGGDLDRLVAGGPYGVLLCDRRLDGRDGADVVRRLRETQPDLPVVCTTGYGELGDTLAALRPRVRLLRKPFDVEDLVRTVGDAAA